MKWPYGALMVFTGKLDVALHDYITHCCKLSNQSLLPSFPNHDAIILLQFFLCAFCLTSDPLTNDTTEILQRRSIRFLLPQSPFSLRWAYLFPCPKIPREAKEINTKLTRIHGLNARPAQKRQKLATQTQHLSAKSSAIKASNFNEKDLSILWGS